MHLKIKVLKPENISLYKNHSTFHEGDSGLDVFFVENQNILKREDGVAVPIYLGISVESTSTFWLMPRSSIVKTPLRMANSMGLIDKGYRGELIACVDNISDLYSQVKTLNRVNNGYKINRGERLFQIVSPTCEPITYELVNELSNTSRNTGGFGSTGI
jgi:dUTP pyrophosphatase